MRKLIILFFFISATLSGQVLKTYPNYVSSIVIEPPFDGGKLTNGNFALGATGWSMTNQFSIGSGKVTESAASYPVESFLSQAAGDMVSPLEANHHYHLSFTISGGTGSDFAWLKFYDTDNTLIGGDAKFATNTTWSDVQITVPAYGSGGAFKISSSISETYTSFSIDNITLVEIP